MILYLWYFLRGAKLLSDVLFDQCRPDDEESIWKLEQKRPLGWTQQQLTSQLQKEGSSFVLRLNGRCVACALFQVVLEQADLLLIVVDEEYRRSGLASHLLSNALDF